jgi:hypothetical protein
MVVRRVGISRAEDQEALAWLEEQAAKGELTEEEVQEAIAALGEEEVDATETYEQMREKYKREKARDGFEKGTGGFRRSE